MNDLLPLLAHLLTTIAKLMGPGGARAVVTDSLLMKQQLLIINRSRKRAPNLSTLDRFLLGFWSLFLNPRHILRAAVIIRPSTLLKFHNLLKQRKYRLLYSASRKGKPGPEGPSPELIQAIVELKQHNPRYGCPRIAQQINKVFGTYIDKDGHVVSSAGCILERNTDSVRRQTSPPTSRKSRSSHLRLCRPRCAYAGTHVRETSAWISCDRVQH